MKKLLHFGLLFISSTVLFSKEPILNPVLDIDGNVILNISTQFHSNLVIPPFNPGNPLVSVTFDSLRPINEVNDLTSADAFPWISLDGLRLYYTHLTLTPGLYYSERPTINDLWSTPVYLNVSGTSFTLSRNELELFACDGADIVHYERANLTSPFINPQIINTTQPGLPNLFRSISFDPSGAQMFVYAYYTGYTKAYELTRTSQLLYNYTREITFPVGYKSSSGRLSVDGLTFYLALNDTNGYYNLARMERPTPFDTFNVATTQFITELVDSANWNSHPCTSQNEEWIVFTKAVSNTWAETNLFIASKSGIINSVSENIHLHCSVFPNPATNILNFEFNGKKNVSSAIKIIGIDGKQIISKNISDLDQFQLDISQLSSGIYFYSVTSGNEFFRDKFVVVR